MRTYEVILLHFRTPVHFGDASEGGGLGDVTAFCRVDREPEFGRYVLDTHFNARSKKPYETGSFYFHGHAGLYLLLSVEEATDLAWLENLIRFTGLNGIGGRRSSGSGKFDFEDDPLILSEDEMYGPDDAALFDMLENDTANVQMTLSSLLPSGNERKAVMEGNGKVVKRSGFACSAETGKPIKVNSVYMMTAGSCFSQRIPGTVADVNNGTLPHPVYRYGKGMYVGMSL